MNFYLKNYEALFSNDHQVVTRAVMEKKDWILAPLFLPLGLEERIDEEGKKHFFQLEALLDDVIYFSSYKKNIPLLKNYRYAKFQTDLLANGTQYPLAYVQYDFRKIDQKGYQELVANFYPCLSKEELEIQDNQELKEALKYFMIGSQNEAVIILDSNQLFHDAYYAPVIRQIIVHPSASEELKSILQGIAEEKQIPCVEVDYAE